MNLLFQAILPTWQPTQDAGYWLVLPRRVRWRLALTLAVCDALALLQTGRTLRLMSVKKRQVFVVALASRSFPWLRRGLAIARATALLTNTRRPA